MQWFGEVDEEFQKVKKVAPVKGKGKPAPKKK